MILLESVSHAEDVTEGSEMAYGSSFILIGAIDLQISKFNAYTKSIVTFCMQERNYQP